MSSRATPSKALGKRTPKGICGFSGGKAAAPGRIDAGGRERGEYGEEPRTGREGERPRAPSPQQNP